MGKLRDMIDNKDVPIPMPKVVDQFIVEQEVLDKAFSSNENSAARKGLDILIKARGNSGEVEYLIEALPKDERKPVRRCVVLYQQRKRYCIAFNKKFWR